MNVLDYIFDVILHLLENDFSFRTNCLLPTGLLLPRLLPLRDTLYQQMDGSLK